MDKAFISATETRQYCNDKTRDKYKLRWQLKYDFNTTQTRLKYNSNTIQIWHKTVTLVPDKDDEATTKRQREQTNIKDLQMQCN